MSVNGEHEPDPQESAALEAQQEFVESALELVFETHRGAVEEGVVEPIVVLLDCEDDLGGQIARGWLGDEAIDDAIALEHADADAEGADVTTAFARALPLAEASGELAEAFPYLADSLAEIDPSDGVVILGVTAGGACLLTAPLDAMET
ncbi:MAG: hypothetical protein AAF805_04755 [Planctomycetota bacterium]